MSPPTSCPPTSWMDTAPGVPVFDGVDREIFERDIQPRQHPAILKGAVSHWPAVAAASQSPEALCDYFKGFATQAPVQAWFGAPDIQGRFSYSDDLKGLNHEQKRLPFAELCDLLLRYRHEAGAPCLYAGGVPMPQVLPGAVKDNPIGLIDDAQDRLTSLWIGNATHTAAHWDLPQNLACVIACRRRFTLMPIDQIANLYVGPVDFTLAGQPISLVDFHNPDFERFPRFRDAMAQAEVAVLEPGDVLYMPSLWFHHVDSLENFGAMINIWWRDGPDYLTTPLLTLYHALLTLHEMPAPERLRWRTLFDHYIFQTGGEPMAHIPTEARGSFGPKTPDILARIRAFLAKSLTR